jgi:hypothetical protein
MAKYFSKTELPFESIINAADSKQMARKGVRRKRKFLGEKCVRFDV